MRKLTVTDFTLKNAVSDSGNQLTFRNKTDIAVCLDRLCVDAVELAPIKNSKEDCVVNRTIANLMKNCTVKMTVGMTQESVDEAWSCLCEAKDPCLRVAVPVSTVQMEYLYHIKAPKMLETVAMLCAAAKEKCEKVELVALDASRADREFLINICSTACSSGAVSVTLCDDAGILMPDETAEMVTAVKSACDIRVSVMTSDAVSMAAANAVAAVKAGADGVETSATGNWLNTGKFSDIMRMRGSDMGVECGLNAAGIHRDVEEIHSIITKGRSALTVTTDDAYSDISLNRESTIADVNEAVRTLGYELSYEDSGKVYEEFKRVSSRKAHIGFKEIDAIVASAAMQVPSTYHVDSFVINSGNIITATANIVLVRDGEKLSGISTGDGPIDAAFLAIEQVIGHHYELDDFQIQSVTEGHEAMGSAMVKLRDGDRLYSGIGVSTDIIGASIRAYVNALNKIVHNDK